MTRSKTAATMCMVVAFVAALALPWATAPVAAQTSQPIDPAAFCRTVGTDDAPAPAAGLRDLPDWMMAAYFTPRDIADFRSGRRPFYGIDWRCVQGDVLICQNAQTPSCMKPDTVRTPSPEMEEFCRTAQGSPPVIPRVVTGTARMLAYDWICRGQEPAIAKETPLDAQGFVAADWKRVAPK
ncbi:MAG: hypothetical protein Q8L22_15750 [Reyranella sp.]|nr:hypothetical protein [Reyranella sp.]